MFSSVVRKLGLRVLVPTVSLRAKFILEPGIILGSRWAASCSAKFADSSLMEVLVIPDTTLGAVLREGSCMSLSEILSRQTRSFLTGM
jgi:hypothetical protein